MRMAEPDQPENALPRPATVAVISDDARLSYLLRRMFELNGLAVVTGYPGQFEGDPNRVLRFLDEREVRVAVWRVSPGDVTGWTFVHLLRERATPSGRRLLIVAEDPDALVAQIAIVAEAEISSLGRDVSSLARLAAAVERALDGSGSGPAVTGDASTSDL
jgi:hypothetical protein